MGTLKVYKSRKKPILLSILIAVVVIILAVVVLFKVQENNLKLNLSINTLSDIKSTDLLATIKTKTKLQNADIFTSPSEFSPITISNDGKIDKIKIEFNSLKNSKTHGFKLMLSSDKNASKITKDLFSEHSNQAYYLSENYVQRVPLDSVITALDKIDIDSLIEKYCTKNEKSYTLTFNQKISTSYDKNKLEESFNSKTPIVFVDKEGIAKEITNSKLLTNFESIGSFSLNKATSIPEVIILVEL